MRQSPKKHRIKRHDFTNGLWRLEDALENAWNDCCQERNDLRRENERLRVALRNVVSDVLDYECVNNLAPNPGRKYCWNSVAKAVALLGKE